MDSLDSQVYLAISSRQLNGGLILQWIQLQPNHIQTSLIQIPSSVSICSVKVSYFCFLLLLNFLCGFPAWLFFLDEKMSLFGGEVTQTTLCLKKSKLVLQKLCVTIFNWLPESGKLQKEKSVNSHFQLLRRQKTFLIWQNSHRFPFLPLLPAIVFSCCKNITFHRKHEKFHKTA